jgi:glycosyltransferase involved in cell wall biosynthesis
MQLNDKGDKGKPTIQTEIDQDRPLRVALVIPTLDQGGAEKQLCLLAIGLLQHRIEPHVVLLTRDGPLRSQLESAGVPITLIGKRSRADVSAYFRLRQWLKHWRGDVMHSWLFAANSYARQAAISVGIPVVLGSERCVDRWKTAMHFCVDRYLAKRSDGLTTNSIGVRDFYVSNGISAEKFTVIANGIQPRRVTEISREEAMKRLQIDPARKLILAVGRLWPQKRYRDLIWSGELLGTTRQDTSLVIIGDGPQADELIRYRDAVTIPEHVRFAGHRDDVAELLPHADLFWNGSEYEGQSNSLIEAMQAGVCVVGSNIPGNRDLVEDRVTGRLAAVGDRADFARISTHLLDHPDERTRFAIAGRERIQQQFTVERMVAEHVTLYRQFFASKSAPNVGPSGKK